MTRILALSALLATTVACTKDSTGDSGDDTEEVVEDTVSPVLSNGTAVCQLHSTGDEFYQVIMNLEYSDPQGLEDVPPTGHTVEFVRGGASLGEAALLVCDKNQGTCLGSFDADLYSISCSTPSEYTFVYKVTDYDGNTGTLEVTGS